VTTVPLPNDAERASAPDLWRPTPLAALELEETPTELHFVRSHFPSPELEPALWSLELRGSARSLALDLDSLRSLPQRTLSVVLECAGHRRAEFKPVPHGLPWATGAVAEARWTGPSLAAVLTQAGVPIDAREVVLEGGDAGPVEGIDGIHRFARSLPLAKALDADVLLAHEINGAPIPVERGGPVRAIVPGWYATDSVKWLERIWFTSEEFDGYFQAEDYRLLAPGEAGAGTRMTELPVHALITTPTDHEHGLVAGERSIRGVAWGGSDGIAEVLVRVDLGAWTPARVGAVRGPYSLTSWELSTTFAPGAHEIACRAIDGAGRAQPDHPSANVRGYGNSAVHRIRIRAS
jgi:DMSO/TMAO reductase YedYZ molybdopterin-dependent catalytic subunit